MNLPIRALCEIRAFSRPTSRPDWRTCKKLEADLIREKQRITHHDWMELVFGVQPLRLEMVRQVNRCGWPHPQYEEEIIEAIPVKCVRSAGGGGCG